MFVIIGTVVMFGAILGGYIMHGGQIGALIQISEIIILNGAALGAMLIGSGMSGLMTVFKAVLGTLKPSPYTKPAFLDSLKMLYALFTLARKEGLLALEQHVERPEESAIFSQNPTFLANHHATHFFCDTMKVVLTGSVGAYELSDLTETDLESHHHEAMKPVDILSKVGDAMPAFGIVAAVLGVVITMGAIDGSPAEIGHKVAAALVGTLLGILMAYGVFQPLAQAVEAIVKAEEQYLQCIRHALISFARGDAPMTCVEFARRSIEPTYRPTFEELEEAAKGAVSAAANQAQAA
ncbi:MAG: flagellar motor stator protein MotA [Armatimonadetes bacterium]|nr:flagellar motor stator protein MotA [Armatimonadota bacterium]